MLFKDYSIMKTKVTGLNGYFFHLHYQAYAIKRNEALKTNIVRENRVIQFGK